jgi:pyridinium-3,5-biscarboxylic acid mononucleotide synthase
MISGIPASLKTHISVAGQVWLVYIIDPLRVSLIGNGGRVYRLRPTGGPTRNAHMVNRPAANRLKRLLSDVRAGRTTPSAAADTISSWSTENLGFARLDHHRSLRQGLPEAVLCTGKTERQVQMLLDRISRRGEVALATRVPEEWAAALQKQCPQGHWHREARLFVLGGRQAAKRRARARIAVASAGTADVPVAEEAAVTAEAYGFGVSRLYDVGVAGLHRLLAVRSELRQARVVIVVAGMDGALPSVVGGLVAAPVIAVPTSIGYGAHLGGLAPLLTMLNSCAPGVLVVNIDNGYGAAVAACRILARPS